MYIHVHVHCNYGHIHVHVHCNYGHIHVHVHVHVLCMYIHYPLQAVRETSGFTERVHLFLDLIISYEVITRGYEVIMVKLDPSPNDVIHYTRSCVPGGRRW